jgi:hypothetical protein
MENKFVIELFSKLGWFWKKLPKKRSSLLFHTKSGWLSQKLKFWESLYMLAFRWSKSQDI